MTYLCFAKVESRLKFGALSGGSELRLGLGFVCAATPSIALPGAGIVVPRICRAAETQRPRDEIVLDLPKTLTRRRWLILCYGTLVVSTDRIPGSGNHVYSVPWEKSGVWSLEGSRDCRDGASFLCVP